MGFAKVEDAVAAVGRGEIVVVVDDEDRENEGDLIMAAEFATPEKIAFFLHHTSGVICAPVTRERARELAHVEAEQPLLGSIEVFCDRLRELGLAGPGRSRE